jgi:mannose-6-phosphate isomerase-like protein (cupin superfamily)
MSVQVIKQHQLPSTDIARELAGADYGAGVCLIFVDAAPGTGPRLHKHAYEEVFVTLEGEATLVAGDETIVARAGDVVVVPADTPHAFTNTGDGPLRQIDIHVSPTFRTEWL